MQLLIDGMTGNFLKDEADKGNKDAAQVLGIVGDITKIVTAEGVNTRNAIEALEHTLSAAKERARAFAYRENTTKALEWAPTNQDRAVDKDDMFEAIHRSQEGFEKELQKLLPP